MTIEADIKTTLDAYGGLSSLISTRSYSGRLPQNPTYPNVYYERVFTEPSNTLGARNILTNVRFQFEVRATTVLSKDNVVAQLKAAMEAATLFTALYTDEVVLPFEDEIQTYRSDIDFSIWYKDN